MAEPGQSKEEAKLAADKAAKAAALNLSNKRFQQTQAQVDEVVDIMRLNVDKVLERDAKLSQLDDRADALQMGASQFEQSAGALKNKFWLKNLKMMIIMGVVSGIFLIVVGAWIYNKMKDPVSPYPAPYPYPQPQPPYAPPEPIVGPTTKSVIRGRVSPKS